MKLKITLSLICMICISSVLSGCTSNKNIPFFNSTDQLEENDYLALDINTDINSGIDSELDSQPINKDKIKTQKISAAIDEVIGEHKDNIALYYYNLNTNEEYYFNEDTYFIAASLKKIPQVMQVLDKIHYGELTLDTKIKYIEEQDYEGGSGILQFQEGLEYETIERLIELAIKESDNIAYNMLRGLCNDTLLEYLETKFKFENLPREQYVKLTAKQNFQILYNLYMNPENNSYYPWAIDLMKETVFNSRLNQYIPRNEVAHKIGSYYRYYHDIGIIDGKEPYILVVLTKDIGNLFYSAEYTIDEESMVIEDWGEEACEIIANISKVVYDIVEQ